MQVGGTSLATPLWAGMATIADQGRVLAGGAPLGATAMLTDLYNLAQIIAPGDFHDITTGKQRLLRRAGLRPGHRAGHAQGQPALPTCPPTAWPASRPSLTQPPPSSSRATPSASSPRPTDSLGIPDPTYTGTATLSLVSGPAGVNFTPVTVPVWRRHGGLRRYHRWAQSRRHPLRVPGQHERPGFNDTDPVVIVAPTAGVSNYYPLPFDTGPYAGWGLPSAVLAADFDGSPSSIITLSISTIPYEASVGPLPFFNGGGGHQDDRRRRPGRDELGHLGRRDQPRRRGLRLVGLTADFKGRWPSRAATRRRQCRPGRRRADPAFGGGLLDRRRHGDAVECRVSE